MARYGSIDEWLLTKKQFKVINANRQSMGLSPLGEDCLKSTERTTNNSTERV